MKIADKFFLFLLVCIGAAHGAFDKQDRYVGDDHANEVEATVKAEPKLKKGHSLKRKNAALPHIKMNSPTLKMNPTVKAHPQQPQHKKASYDRVKGTKNSPSPSPSSSPPSGPSGTPPGKKSGTPPGKKSDKIAPKKATTDFGQAPKKATTDFGQVDPSYWLNAQRTIAKELARKAASAAKQIANQNLHEMKEKAESKMDQKSNELRQAYNSTLGSVLPPDERDEMWNQIDDRLRNHWADQYQEQLEKFQKWYEWYILVFLGFSTAAEYLKKRKRDEDDDGNNSGSGGSSSSGGIQPRNLIRIGNSHGR